METTSLRLYDNSLSFRNGDNPVLMVSHFTSAEQNQAKKQIQFLPC